MCLVVDDVRHAYGSVVDDTMRCLLRLAGFPEVVIDLLLLATTEATVHTGCVRLPFVGRPPVHGNLSSRAEVCGCHPLCVL